MKYFKKSELVKLYGISDKTARNWVTAAEQGKINIELCFVNGKVYIADTVQNERELKELAERSKKYQNKLSRRIAKPTNLFYEIFSDAQIVDIINGLEKYNECPLYYHYFGRGAEYWDAYLQKLYTAGISNYLTATIELLGLDLPYMLDATSKYEFVNLVDVGVGNGLAAKKLLAELLETGRLRRYIGIDISPYLLEITGRNIKEWFGEKVSFEQHVKDITYERFPEIIARESFANDASKTLNLILFLGGAITNFRDPDQAVKTIRDSMSKNDVLITSIKLDNEKSRRFFDFNIDSDRNILPDHHKLILDLLGIDENCYEQEQIFDEQLKSRFIQVRLKVALSIEFEIGKFQKAIEFRKGELIRLCRILHFTDREVIDIFERNGFAMLRSAKSKDEEFMLLVVKQN